MGGDHIQADNIAGLELGRKVAFYVWPIVQANFDGTSERSQRSSPPPRSDTRMNSKKVEAC
jgi:hypothetical protein